MKHLSRANTIRFLIPSNISRISQFKHSSRFFVGNRAMPANPWPNLYIYIYIQRDNFYKILNTRYILFVMNSQLKNNRELSTRNSNFTLSLRRSSVKKWQPMKNEEGFRVRPFKEIYDVLKLFASLNPRKTLEMERLSSIYLEKSSRI